MCEWMHEEIKEKETVNAKAKVKNIKEFEREEEEERPLTAIR
jgi:hypothetical protein